MGLIATGAARRPTGESTVLPEIAGKDAGAAENGARRPHSGSAGRPSLQWRKPAPQPPPCRPHASRHRQAVHGDHRRGDRRARNTLLRDTRRATVLAGKGTAVNHRSLLRRRLAHTVGGAAAATGQWPAVRIAKPYLPRPSARRPPPYRPGIPGAGKGCEGCSDWPSARLRRG